MEQNTGSRKVSGATRTSGGPTLRDAHHMDAEELLAAMRREFRTARPSDASEVSDTGTAPYVAADRMEWLYRDDPEMALRMLLGWAEDYARQCGAGFAALKLAGLYLETRTPELERALSHVLDSVECVLATPESAVAFYVVEQVIAFNADKETLEDLNESFWVSVVWGIRHAATIIVNGDEGDTARDSATWFAVRDLFQIAGLNVEVAA